MVSGNSLRNDIQDNIYDGTGGTLLRLKGTNQKSGTLLDIDASGLVDGRAIRVTSFNSLESGALLDIYTNTSTGHGNKTVRYCTFDGQCNGNRHSHENQYK